MTKDLSADHELLVLRIMDAIRRTAVHYGLWFSESVHQFGLDTALDMEQEAGDRFMHAALSRFARDMGMELREVRGHKLPELLLRMDADRLECIYNALCTNWLACDGVWFQAAEAHAPTAMHDAKRVNDTCWNRFSPLEANRIKALLEFSEASSPREALEQCKAALGLRLYAQVNKQEIVEETPDSFVFRMSNCRVQAARNRKGLEDYPCKSGGIVEYTTFARTIDPRIKVTCLACPPDPHPAAWFCAWKFFV